MSILTKDDVRNVQIDPMAAVGLVLSKISEADNDVVVVDPSNPFSFMLETIIVNSAVLRDELITKHARTHSKLANSESDLYNNISYKDFKNVFSQPSNNIFRFYVNIVNFNSNAITSPTGDYKMVSIPEGTIVSVEGYNFLITNRIDIKQFSNGVFSIEQNVSSNELGVSTLGVLPYLTYKTDDENTFILFETVLNQLTPIELEYTIKQSDRVVELVDIPDSVHYITASIRNSTGVVPVAVSYSEIIDPLLPTVLVKILTKSVEITVPDVYLLNNMLVGKLLITIYTTKGVVDYPMDKIPSDLYTLTYNNISTDEYTSIINKVGITVNATQRLTGGTNGKSFTELREAIINNSMGDNNVPITSNQLLDMLSNDGYDGYLLKDTVTSRTYIASRTLLTKTGNLLKNANPDILFYRTKIIPTDYENHPMVITTTDSDDKLIIKPYTIFKKISNGIVPLTKDELLEFNNMTLDNRVSLLNSEKFIYSPYAYISSTKDGVYHLRIVDYSATEVKGFSINAINPTTTAKINIKSYTMSLRDNGYRLIINTVTNTEFDTVDKTLVRAQLKIPIDGINNVYFYSNYNDGVLQFDIQTSFYVNTDMKLLIENGNSELATKFIDLLVNATLTTYIESPDVEYNTSTYINNSLMVDETITVFTTETMNILFGNPIEHLYKNITVSYTNRKYLTYTEDVFARYDSDIYDTDSLGSLLTPNATEDDVTYTLLHAKGDIIMDANDNPIIIHRQGDYKLDANDNPIIDITNGVIKYIDMMLLEYNHYLSSPSESAEVIDAVDAYLYDMKSYSEVVLEETAILFKPYTSNNAVKLKFNNNYRVVSTELKPSVTLYVEKDINPTEADYIYLKNAIGAIIHKYLNKEMFEVNDIRTDIKKSIVYDIVAVSIKLDPTIEVLESAERVVLYDATNRLSLSKVITKALGGLNLVYDINITIVKL